jgi:hypothetical protein
MKRQEIFGLILILTLAAGGCTKLKDPAGERNAAAVPVISDVNPGIFDSKDLVNSYVEFKVSLDPGVQAEKASIQASYDNNGQRTEVAQVTSFPATVRIVSGDVLQKLGLAPADIANGDVFNLEVLLTSGGLSTRSNAILNVPVACGFEKTLSVGSYHSVSADWNSSGNITLAASPDDPYTILVTGIEAIEGAVEDKGPLVMHIDPATFNVTAGKSVIASDFFGYHNVAYEGTGVYNSCDGSYEMLFDISVDEGDFGVYNFTFTRNP